jgi:hypothetical protein
MFASLVVLVRNRIGKAKFNQVRGKAIALHCQAITNFCNGVGLETQIRQNLIRTAKSNGKKLGLLA